MQTINRDTTITVGTSSVEIAPLRSSRVVIYITNTSTTAQKITIRKGETAGISGEGLSLNPGDSWYESDGANFRCWRGPIQAISDGADGTLAISEEMVI